MTRNDLLRNIFCGLEKNLPREINSTNSQAYIKGIAGFLKTYKCDLIANPYYFGEEIGNAVTRLLGEEVSSSTLSAGLKLALIPPGIEAERFRNSGRINKQKTLLKICKVLKECGVTEILTQDLLDYTNREYRGLGADFKNSDIINIRGRWVDVNGELGINISGNQNHIRIN